MIEKVSFYLAVGLYLAIITRNPAGLSNAISSTGGAVSSVFGTLLG